MNNTYCSTLYCGDIYTWFNETYSSISKITICRLYIRSLNYENLVVFSRKRINRSGVCLRLSFVKKKKKLVSAIKYKYKYFILI